jgi:hypothetical protein
MNASSLKAKLSEYDALFSVFNEKLKPIGSRPILTLEDIEEQKKRPPFLDEAGIRVDAENVLAAVTELYATIPDAREPIREMFRRHRFVRWALWPLSQKPTTEQGFTSWLLRFSIDDEYRDARDVLEGLWRVCREAEDAGVKIRPILESVAAISSNADPYGWGSVRKMMLKAHICCRTQSWALKD